MHPFRTLLVVLAACLLLASGREGHCAAEEISLHAAPELVEAGLVRHLAPRFRFRSGIRITLAPSPEEADMALMAEDAVDGQIMARARLARPVFVNRKNGRRYLLLILTADEEKAAAASAFLDWLLNGPGKATLESFPDGEHPAFEAIERAGMPVTPASFKGDPVRGYQLARLHCRRCHVIDEKDKFAGIGSTPSFMALKALPDWQQRFSVYWTLPPHRGLVDVEAMSEPRPLSQPLPIAPVKMTLDDVEDILAYVASLEAKDLGKPIEMR